MSEIINKKGLEKIKSRKKNKSIPAEDLNELIVSLIQDKKGNDIVSLDLRRIPEAITDYFVICHCESTTQTRAIVDHLEEEVRKQTLLKPLHVEGRSNGEWCLIDFGDIVVHIFQREKREFYQLEDLWSDAVMERYA
ncbi:MAG: rsfS [Bacteroidota bacterium]|nr:rsfS [Bacteroidota bacterium]